jgi:hypothetical protein
LQGEENKGVELTGGSGNVGEPGDEGERMLRKDLEEACDQIERAIGTGS